jgi:predicted P-loop ATPase
MIAAVARVTEPGCKSDCALILEGPQGLLKSTALKTLAHPWFTDEIADFGTKDAALQLAGAWIIELPELDSISRPSVSRIKAFMSRTTDRFRPPYGRRVVEQPRQCLFAGTVNGSEYLRDESGGRRWWPIACSNIDIDGLAADRDQLWAEARDRYAAGEPWWLDTDELNFCAAEEQSARFQADPWQEMIEQRVVGQPSVSVGEVLSFLGIPKKDLTQAQANRVSACLKALGWKRKQIRIGGKKQWRYVTSVTSGRE